MTGRKWLVAFNAGTTQLVSLDWCNNTGAIDVKMDGSVLEETSYFKMLGLTFSSKLDWDSYMICITKSAARKIAAFIRFVKFFSPEVALFLYAWSTTVKSGLVLLVVTWNCKISYKNRYAELLVLHLLPLLNIWLIVEM